MTPDPALNPHWARIQSGRYRRNFGGRDRTTRDLLLLDDIIADLAAVVPKLVGSDRDAAERQLEMLKNERPKIVDAQSRGSNDDRISRLGNRANDQFANYKNAFAGQSRTSRDPLLLRRMITSLERIQGEMEGLRGASVKSETNDRNIGVVSERIAAWKTELSAVEAAQVQVGTEIRAHLGRSANEVFDAYRKEFQGKDRASCDPDRLHVLCEQLHPIAKRMARVEGDDAVNAQNLRLVVEHLDLYEREFGQVVQARISAKAGLA